MPRIAKAREVMRGPYEVSSVITAVLGTLESTMRDSTPELLREAILEGYRQAAAGHDHLERTSVIFAEVFGKAQDDGKLPADFDIATSRSSHSHWSARVPATGRGLLPGPLVRGGGRGDIAALVAGYSLR